MTRLPEGRYFSCGFAVDPDAGGQTRALLMRARILAAEGGVRPDVLTFDACRDYDERRRTLLERGLITGGVRLLNLYEHYRDHAAGEPTGEGLADLGRHRVGEDSWRVRYRPAGSDRPVYDYLRADGSPYLRIGAFSVSDPASWRVPVQLVAPGGEVVREFDAVGQWFRRWLRDLAGDAERAFVFMDSRHLMPQLVPMRSRRIHLIYLMHNLHVLEPRRWDSPMTGAYRRVLARIDGLDAMVCLTERQRDDIAERRGRTSNLFVVPNPVEAPGPPPGVARDPGLVAIVARLEGQKRLTHAVAAFRRVVEAVPGARLDVYGEGRKRARLQALIDAEGLAGSVRLRGFDPHARDALWRASAFLMTSAYEGYPLSTLESMSHGCPVVSYDIRYGPREQIEDGVDGFLVPEGDVGALADRVIELLRSPELVARMGAAATAKAERFGPRPFLESWAEVLRAAVRLKPDRTRIEAAAFEPARLRVAGRLRRDFVPAPVPAGGALELAGVLRVEGRGSLESAQVSLAVVDAGEVTELPVGVERDASELRVRALVRPDAVREEARLRLRLIWGNSAWETEVGRPGGGDGVDVSYAPDGALRLTRRSGASARDLG